MSNLGITPVAASQNQKEVTINAADARIVAALTEILAVSVASGNATVSSDSYQQAIHIQVSGASVAGRTVALPAVKRGLLLLSAAAANVESVEFLCGTGSVVLLPGQVAVALTDGTANGLYGYVLADSGGALTLESLTDVVLTDPQDGDVLTYDAAEDAWKNVPPSGGGGGGSELEVLGFALSDETTAITAGAGKHTVRMPFAMTVTAVRASLTAASSSGVVTVDINEGGSTILSTKLTIDASEKTSTTAATPAVISDSALADDAEITFDIDTAGTGAAGLKVWLIGTRA